MAEQDETDVLVTVMHSNGTRTDFHLQIPPNGYWEQVFPDTITIRGFRVSTGEHHG